MAADQQKEEVIPIAFTQGVTGEQENKAANDDGYKSENQMPWPHTPLPGFRILNQPAIEQANTNGQNLGNRHDDLINAPIC